MMLRAVNLRSALLLGSAAVLPVAAASAAAPTEVRAGEFTAPATPVVLTRELRRALVDGKEVVSRRSYELTFVREGSGWRVDGKLVASEVEAPPQLAMLAEIEKRRPDAGLFPLHLDLRGMIIAQQGASDAEPAANARQTVTNAVERVSVAPAQKALAGDYAAKIVALGRVIGGNWPEDLFRPQTTKGSLVREMALPGGKSGRVTVSVDARRGADGMLERFSRMVTTELDGTRRDSMETWSISN